MVRTVRSCWLYPILYQSADSSQTSGTHRECRIRGHFPVWDLYCPNKKCPREVRLCGSPSSLAVCEMVPAAQPGTSDLEIAKDRGPAEGCMKPKPDFSAHLHGQIESLDQGGWTSCRQTGEVVFPFHPSENYLLTTAHILGLKLPFPSPLKI